MRESRTYGSVRGACDETHVPTATTAAIHTLARRRGARGRSRHARSSRQERRIGVITSLAADDPEEQARIAAFLQALQELGWTVGRNLQIDYRWGAGDANRNRKDAAELVALAPDVILAYGNPTLEPLLKATRIVPIVFVQITDPVGAGLVESLARPGGNATGFTTAIRHERKMAGAAQEIAPNVKRVAVLRDETRPPDRPVRRDPGRGAVIRGGIAPHRRVRHRRD